MKSGLKLVSQIVATKSLASNFHVEMEKLVGKMFPVRD